MTTENPTSFGQASSARWPHLPDRSASPGGDPVWVKLRRTGTGTARSIKLQQWKFCRQPGTAAQCPSRSSPVLLEPSPSTGALASAIEWLDLSLCSHSRQPSPEAGRFGSRTIPVARRARAAYRVRVSRLFKAMRPPTTPRPWRCMCGSASMVLRTFLDAMPECGADSRRALAGGAKGVRPSLRGDAVFGMTSGSPPMVQRRVRVGEAAAQAHLRVDRRDSAQGSVAGRYLAETPYEKL